MLEIIDVWELGRMLLSCTFLARVGTMTFPKQKTHWTIMGYCFGCINICCKILPRNMHLAFRLWMFWWLQTWYKSSNISCFLSLFSRAQWKKNVLDIYLEYFLGLDCCVLIFANNCFFWVFDKFFPNELQINMCLMFLHNSQQSSICGEQRVPYLHVISLLICSLSQSKPSI